MRLGGGTVRDSRIGCPLLSNTALPSASRAGTICVEGSHAGVAVMQTQHRMRGHLKTKATTSSDLHRRRGTRSWRLCRRRRWWSHARSIGCYYSLAAIFRNN